MQQHDNFWIFLLDRATMEAARQEWLEIEEKSYNKDPDAEDDDDADAYPPFRLTPVQFSENAARGRSCWLIRPSRWRSLTISCALSISS